MRSRSRAKISSGAAPVPFTPQNPRHLPCDCGGSTMTMPTRMQIQPIVTSAFPELTTEELAELVRLHAEKPVTLIELKHAFAASPHASDGLHNVRSAANERARRMYLLMFLLRKIDEFNRESPDELMVKPDVLWGAAAGDPRRQGRHPCRRRQRSAPARSTGNPRPSRRRSLPSASLPRRSPANRGGVRPTVDHGRRRARRAIRRIRNGPRELVRTLRREPSP